MIGGARVLVTGGRGFLGKHVCAALRSRDAEPVVVGRQEVDLRDEAATARYIAHLAPDFVIHTAATGGGIGWMKQHPHTALLDNVRLNTSVLEASRGARRIVGVSSACAYAVDASQPMGEDALFAGEPEPTNGPYGHAKRLMLVHGAALVAEHGIDCAFVVPTNLYGPGEDMSPERSHVVGALIRRFEEARKQGADEVTCWGSGRATRDLLYVQDAAEGIVQLLEVGGGPAPINLGSGVERSIAEIADAVARAVGWSGRILWDAAKPDGMPRKVLDITRAQQRLGWTPRVDLDAGLRHTVAWYRSSSC